MREYFPAVGKLVETGGEPGKVAVVGRLGGSVRCRHPPRDGGRKCVHFLRPWYTVADCQIIKVLIIPYILLSMYKTFLFYAV